MGDNEGVPVRRRQGKIVCTCYGESPRIIPESQDAGRSAGPAAVPRSPGHHQEWIDACKGGPSRVRISSMRPSWRKSCNWATWPFAAGGIKPRTDTP